MADAPFTKRETTLRQVAADPGYKGWYVKVSDGEEPFVVPIEMFFSMYESEHDPELDEEQTAYFNECGTVVLLIGYPSKPVVTLLSNSAALDYLYTQTMG